MRRRFLISYLCRCVWSQQPFLLHKNSWSKWEMVTRSGREKYMLFDTASCYKELLFHISFFTCISVYTHIYKYCWYECRDRCSQRYTEKKRLIEMILQMLLLFSHSVVSDSFVTPWTVAHQAPLSMGFSRQDLSGLPFSSPGDLPNPRIEHVTPVLAGRFFTIKPPGKPSLQMIHI